MGCNVKLGCKYHTETELQSMDMYYPEGVKNCGVLIYLHGGGNYEGSNREWYIPRLGRYMADYRRFERPIACVFPNYYLGPIPKNWAQSLTTARLAIRDIYLCIRRIIDKVAQINGNPDFVVLGGGSAGAADLGWLVFGDQDDPDPHQRWEIQLEAGKVITEFDLNLMGYIWNWGALPGETGPIVAQAGGTGYNYLANGGPYKPIMMHHSTGDPNPSTPFNTSIHVGLSYIDAGYEVNRSVRMHPIPCDIHNPWASYGFIIADRMVDFVNQLIDSYPDFPPFPIQSDLYSWPAWNP